MTNTSISSLAIVVVVGISVFMGMFTFMSDLQSSGYNITVPTESAEDMEELFEQMNKTGTDIETTLIGEQAWYQTAYSIFFRIPNTIISTLSTIANTASKLASISYGEKSGLPIPSWIPSMLMIMIALIVTFTLIYLVLGRWP